MQVFLSMATMGRTPPVARNGVLQGRCTVSKVSWTPLGRNPSFWNLVRRHAQAVEWWEYNEEPCEEPFLLLDLFDIYWYDILFQIHVVYNIDMVTGACINWFILHSISFMMTYKYRYARGKIFGDGNKTSAINLQQIKVKTS